MPSLSEIAKHIGVSKTRAVQLKQMGMPVTNLRAAKLWRDRQGLRRAPTNGRPAVVPVKKVNRPRKSSEPSDTGDSLEDSLKDAIAVSKTAYRAYHDELLAESSSVSSRLSEFNKALRGRQDAERLYREELERRSILVPRSALVDKCRRAMDVMLRRLRKLPNETGPQCAGLEAIHIVTVLQKAVDEVLLSGQRSMNEL